MMSRITLNLKKSAHKNYEDDRVRPTFPTTSLFGSKSRMSFAPPPVKVQVGAQSYASSSVPMTPLSPRRPESVHSMESFVEPRVQIPGIEPKGVNYNRDW
jgi:hypothetical protein